MRIQTRPLLNSLVAVTAASAVVSINAQITPSRDERRFAELRHIYALTVCAALR